MQRYYLITYTTYKALCYPTLYVKLFYLAKQFKQQFSELLILIKESKVTKIRPEQKKEAGNHPCPSTSKLIIYNHTIHILNKNIPLHDFLYEQCTTSERPVLKRLLKTDRCHKKLMPNNLFPLERYRYTSHTPLS